MKSLSAPLLLINIMLLFLPLGTLLYLDTYETQLLSAQENSMIQQGRILSSALTGKDLTLEARRILANLGMRVDSRIRVVDRRGNLVADSATLGVPDLAGIPEDRDSPESTDFFTVQPGMPPISGSGDSVKPEKSANTHFLYRIAVYPLNTIKKFFFPPPVTYTTGEYYSGQSVLMGPEIQAALEGRYGAVTRYSTGGQVSVNLYSAIPVFSDTPGEVLGAVLVSRSTYGILINLYQLRLDIIKIFLLSLCVSFLLTLGLSFSITIPIKRLKKEAEKVMDQSGRFQEHFRGLKRKDEIGDLSRSLSGLSQKLEKRISFIDGFTADLLHELKNPLAAIRAAVDISLSSPQKEESLLQGIKQEEQRMERLLARLREVSLLDNDMDRENKETLDLGQVVPLILSRYPHRDYPDRKILFENKAAGPALVSANADRLVQMLTNPIDNALSFSPPGGLVIVTLEAQKNKPRPGWHVFIDDQGPGIREESRDLFFERFYSERPQGDKDNHSGLGLSIVQSIVSAYGGSCRLENRKNGGCRFLLFLPAP